MFDGNIQDAFIVDNKYFKTGPASDSFLDENFFGPHVYREQKAALRKLTFNMCFSGNRVLAIKEFNTLGIVLNAATWLRLQAALLFNKRAYFHLLFKKSTPINTFLINHKKGSSKFRKILEYKITSSADPTNLQIVTKFADLTDTPVPAAICLNTPLGASPGLTTTCVIFSSNLGTMSYL